MPLSTSCSNRFLRINLFTLLIAAIGLQADGQEDSASLAKIEELRTQSGVDPTRVQSRAGYSLLIQDFPDGRGMVTNRLSLNIGVNRWAFSLKTEAVSRTPESPGTGFQSGFGDLRFSLLNAILVKGKHAIAASTEFSIPTGGTRYGIGYFAATPSLTYSYTIKPTLFAAFQPQYTFHLMKDPLFPKLSVLTIRSFMALFTKSGYFFVFEPRPSYDFNASTLDFVVSPIIGKSLGGGFNLIGLAEIPFTSSIRKFRGYSYQIGFNKNF